MGVPEFGNLKSDLAVGKLNDYLATRSYISGVRPTQDDVVVFSKMLCAPSASKFVDANRWYRHICYFSAVEKASWPKSEMKTEVPAAVEKEEEFDLFGDDVEQDAIKELSQTKKQTTASGKKKQVVSKSSLVIEVKPADINTDLDTVARLCRQIKVEGVTWGEAVKKVPVAFGLFKLQLCCTILDDIVNTNEITDQIEALGLNAEQLEKLRKRQEEGDSGDEDEDEEPVGLVQSAEIVSFNKL